MTPPNRPSLLVSLLRSQQGQIAALALVMIALHLLLRYGMELDGRFLTIPFHVLPLLFTLLLGGLPLVIRIGRQVLRRSFGADVLAALSIVTSVVLAEYLAGSLVVLMLAGGEALEAYALHSASSVLDALARRMPTLAHRLRNEQTEEVELDDVMVGDTLLVLPHEICPVDGTVLAGQSAMDESYLTGEPYLMSKTPGAAVLSGAINGASALTIRADKRAVDSRYAKIMQVMRDSEQHRPRLRRLGDQLGAWYTPLALAVALTAWLASGDSLRFLAVLVVATPCPLLIAIPVAIIGSISLAARRGIIIKDPAVLEKVDTCSVVIFDKTGTLTYGEPVLSAILPAPGFREDEVLRLAASLERYSKHPLAGAIVAAADAGDLQLTAADAISEAPGEGLRGTVDGRRVEITGRAHFLRRWPESEALLPAGAAGMECLILIDDRYAAVLRFRDEPRSDGASFIRHLQPRHRFDRVLIVSGDRESEVRYLADKVGISEVYFSQSPEAKLALVRKETARAATIFLGDGINDAPALSAATVGIAFGQNSDITAEAAGAVIMDSSLRKVDEFFHVGRRMRRIALQSAVGGMLLSLLAMLVAAAGYLPPVAGALTQELIDVAAVLNALRVALPPASLTDYDAGVS